MGSVIRLEPTRLDSWSTCRSQFDRLLCCASYFIVGKTLQHNDVWQSVCSVSHITHRQEEVQSSMRQYEIRMPANLFADPTRRRHSLHWRKARGSKVVSSGWRKRSFRGIEASLQSDSRASPALARTTHFQRHSSASLTVLVARVYSKTVGRGTSPVLAFGTRSNLHLARRNTTHALTLRLWIRNRRRYRDTEPGRTRFRLSAPTLIAATTGVEQFQYLGGTRWGRRATASARTTGDLLWQDRVAGVFPQSKIGIHASSLAH